MNRFPVGIFIVLALMAFVFGCGEEPSVEPLPLPFDDEDPIEQVVEMRVEPGPLRLVVGESRSLEVELLNERGELVEDPRWFQEVEFTSLAPEVVSVQGYGELEGVGEGSTEIQVRLRGFEAVLEAEVKNARWRKVSSGESNTCGLNWQGEIYCWGNNGSRIIANPNSVEPVVFQPLRRGGLPEIVDIEVGFTNACAIDKQGWVYCWGRNQTFQSAEFSQDPIVEPMRLVGLENIVKVTLGMYHGCALSGEGSLYCWGNNREGMIAGTEEERTNVPVRAPIQEPLKDVVAGFRNTCALTVGGDVYCWGDNRLGQIRADEQVVMIREPRRIELEGPAKSIAFGEAVGCAALESGEVQCWGYNVLGALGFPATELLYPPIVVAGLPSVESVEIGGMTTCARTEEEELYCWGQNQLGQTGRGVKSFSATPAKVSGEGKWGQVSVGWSHTCALDEESEIRCWGDNTYAQIGDQRQIWGLEFRPVESEERFSRLVSAYYGTCGKSLGDGHWYCWGRNTEYQFQSADEGFLNVPTRLGPWETEELFLGGYGSCGFQTGVTGNNDTYCWGRNEHNNLGLNRPFQDYYESTRVDTNQRFEQISMNEYHSCGVNIGGEIWCWGNNLGGEVGIDPSLSARVPHRVEARNDYVSVSTGEVHSCGLTVEGEIRCWGWNRSGQLGRAPTEQWGAPATIASDAVYVQVETGNMTTCARTDDQRVHCWGARLVFGGPSGSSTGANPIVLSGQWDRIEHHSNNVCGVRAGQLSCAGTNEYGMLETSHVAFMNDFRAVPLGFEITEVSLGRFHLCALDRDGRAHCRGTNFNGELGDGAMVEHLEPFLAHGE